MMLGFCEMSDEKAKITKEVIKEIEKENIYCKVTLRGNGQLRVGNILLWATSKKWYDYGVQFGGRGIKTFIDHINTKKYKQYN